MEHCRISSQPDYTLAGHQKRVECFTFHPIFQDLLASSSTDGCIKLWSLSAPSKELFSLSPLANDSEHFSQLAFDAFGCQIAGLTNQARLTLIDPRSSSVSSVTLESGHVKTKPCQLSWAHPDPILITTGFSKASTRQVKLWDQRNLKESMQVLDLGLGVAPFQIFWDDSLPLLYLTARNEAIQILELRQGTMKPVAQVDGAATGYAMLSKKNNNTAKCEIARFLRLRYFFFSLLDYNGFTCLI